jgi:fused signal recognition particle receptor
MSRTWGELLGDAGTDETPAEQAGFFGRLRESLSKSRRALTQQLVAFDPNDEDAWQLLEEALITADVGVPATAEIVRRLEERGGLEGFEGVLASMLGEPGSLDLSARPSVILVVGVNGTGKTTTIGKLAAKLAEHDRSVLLAAADTFRAAAEALEVGATRRRGFVGSPRGDPAAVAYDAIDAAASAAGRRGRRHRRPAAPRRT